MKKMKKILVLLCTVTLIFGVVGAANAFLFDFDSLPIGAGDAAIETYMEGIYGSDMTVTGAIVANGGPPEFGTDNYLTFAGPADGFSITFEAIPIASVQFDWGVDYHNLNLDADGTNVFHQRWGHLVLGQELLAFSPAVSTLEFYGKDNNSGMFMIDNLGSTPSPEPGTLFLLGSGLLGFARVGRKHLLKRAT